MTLERLSKLNEKKNELELSGICVIELENSKWFTLKLGEQEVCRTPHPSVISLYLDDIHTERKKEQEERAKLDETVIRRQLKEYYYHNNGCQREIKVLFACKKELIRLMGEHEWESEVYGSKDELWAYLDFCETLTEEFCFMVVYNHVEGKFKSYRSLIVLNEDYPLLTKWMINQGITLYQRFTNYQ